MICLSKFNLLVYGLRDNELFYISKVKNGLACNCICPNCKSPLVAKNNPNNKKAPHFAHHSGVECQGAVESVLHLLSKEVFKQNRKLFLPDFHHDYNPANRNSLYREGELIEFDDVIIEKSFKIDNETIVCDAVAVKNGKELLIEFANSHFIDFEKKSKIIKLGLPCIEIDVSSMEQNVESIASMLENKSDNKRWILNPILEELYSKSKPQNQHLSILISQKNNKIEKQFDWKKNRRIEILKNFKKEFYNHPILKKIIDGGKWNGKIYGQFANESYIFIDNEKYVLNPPINKIILNEFEGLEEKKLLNRGLKLIKNELRKLK